MSEPQDRRQPEQSFRSREEVIRRFQELRGKDHHPDVEYKTFPDSLMEVSRAKKTGIISRRYYPAIPSVVSSMCASVASFNPDGGVSIDQYGEEHDGNIDESISIRLNQNPDLSGGYISAEIANRILRGSYTRRTGELENIEFNPDFRSWHQELKVRNARGLPSIGPLLHLTKDRLERIKSGDSIRVERGECSVDVVYDANEDAYILESRMADELRDRIVMSAKINTSQINDDLFPLDDFMDPYNAEPNVDRTWLRANLIHKFGIEWERYEREKL